MLQVCWLNKRAVPAVPRKAKFILATTLETLDLCMCMCMCVAELRSKRNKQLVAEKMYPKAEKNEDGVIIGIEKRRSFSRRGDGA